MLHRVIGQSKPKRATVELRPSRIRRDPVLLQSAVEPKPLSPEREAWATAAGVVLFAFAAAALAVGFGEITGHGSDAAPARAERFGQCYNNARSDCVIDGDTLYIGGQRLEIAGMDAPEIRGSRCPAETNRGIQAAVRLAALLNSGAVTIGGVERQADGQLLRRIAVDGRDVGKAMVGAGVARRYGSGLDWC